MNELKTTTTTNDDGAIYIYKFKKIIYIKEAKKKETVKIKFEFISFYENDVRIISP